MNNLIVKHNKPSDCEILENKFDNTLDDFGNCFDSILDEKKSKLNVVGSIFKFGFSLTKLTLGVAGCAIKNTPKAVVAVAAVKREIVTELETGYREYQKELKEDALQEKIEALKLLKHERKAIGI